MKKREKESFIEKRFFSFSIFFTLNDGAVFLQIFFTITLSTFYSRNSSNDRNMPQSGVNSVIPNPFANVANAEPLLKGHEKGHAAANEWKVHKKPKGPGIYVVVKCGASGHNIRSNPNLLAPPIGMLALGDVVNVLRTKEVNGEVWVQLDLESAEKHCFATDDGDAWSLAYSNTDILYLETSAKAEDQLSGEFRFRCCQLSAKIEEFDFT